MKKILSLFLAALMIFSVLPAAFAADVETIANIEETSEYAEAIKFLNMLDVYTGMGNGDLAADQLVQRWQMANFLYRVATGDVDHSDVKTTTNYTPFKGINVGDFDGSCAENLGAISWAYQAKVVNGYSATEYGPTDEILYQDAITMIVRLLGERYSAASYPYGFVTTARELGLLDGITGVGLEEEINRGVVAQLLYNAMFVEIDGVSLAEKAFDLGSATVMVTASNKVVYGADESTVLRTDMIRFAAVDAQGEPTGASYHVAAADFGLETAKDANDAVGTLYNVYYKDNMAEIISAEALWTVYENKGHDHIEISVASGKITIAGSTYKVVSAYTDLNRKQGPNTTAAGTAEMKVFDDLGATLNSYNTKYIIAANGNVYDITKSVTEPAYYYSPVLDVYYTYSADDLTKWVIKTDAEMEAILKSSEAAKPGFDSYSISSPYIISAYTKATVSANERVTIREYQFGKITFGKTNYDLNYNGKIDTAEKKVKSFAIATNANADGRKTGWNGVAVDSSDTTSGTGEKAVADYRWSGIADTAISNGSYILYYINDTQGAKEIEVIEIIDATAEEDSYVVHGYFRGFDINKNTISYSTNFSSERIELSYDYNTLKGGQLKKLDTTNNKIDVIFNVFSNLYDKYVEMVVVDGKLVYIESESVTSDYVIIDKIVEYDETGIKVQGWTTVTNEYTTFTVKSYNGWTVGGSFDYWALFLSGLFNGNLSNTTFAANLGIETKVLYKVAARDGDLYDLTAKGASLAAPANFAGLKVNEYGIIEGVQSGKLNVSGWTATSAKDYWLILNTATKEVIEVPGKIAAGISFTSDAEFYKAKDGDYVIIISDASEMIGSQILAGSEVKFFMYDREVAIYNNANYPNYTNYEYNVYMLNVATNSYETVKIDSKLLQKLGYDASKIFDAEGTYLTEGAIYQVVDGVLTADLTGETVDLVEWSYADVVAYYEANVKGYKAYNKSFVGGTAWADILNIVTDVMEDELRPSMTISGTTIFDSKVTVYFKNGHTQAKITDNSKVNDSSKTYSIDFVINKDAETAIAWVDVVPAE